MKPLIIAIILFILASVSANRKFRVHFKEHKENVADSVTIWAVLVCGSKGWSNYRHQVPIMMNFFNDFSLIFVCCYSGRH